MLKKFLLLTLVFGAFFGVSANALAADGGRELYIDPGVGLWSVTEQNQLDPVLKVGTAVGFTYGLTDRLNGRTRVEGTWLQGVEGNGRDLRVGTFVGWRNAGGGFEVGLDVFQNRFHVRDLELHDSLGLELPVRMYLGPEVAHMVVGVSTAWLQHPQRRVDWSTATLQGGFGHEFAWTVGVGSQLRKTRVAVVYTRRQVAGDVIDGLNIQVGR